MGAKLQGLMFFSTLPMAALIGAMAARSGCVQPLVQHLGAGLAGLFLSSLGFFASHFIGNAVMLSAGVSNCLPAVLALQFAAVVGLALRKPTAAAGTTPRPVPPEPRPRGVLAWVGGFYVLIGLLAVLCPPQGFEATAYHLPTAVSFLNKGNLLPWEPQFPHNFPANASLLFAALLGALPERIVSLSGIVFVTLIGLSGASLVEVIGTDSWATRAAVAGALSLPMVIHGSVEANADLGGCAFMLLSCAVLLQPAFRGKHLVSGLALGLAFGFKSLQLIALIPLLAVAAWQGCLAAGTPLTRIQRATVAGGSLGLGFLLMSGFWLGRNQVLFGNPLYPVAVPVLGHLLHLPSEPSLSATLRHDMQLEWVHDSWEWLIYPWTESQQYGQAHKHSSGLGPFFASIAIPALLFNLVQAARGQLNRAALQLLAIAGFLLAAWWCLDDRQPRYALGAQLLLVVLAAPALADTGPGTRRIVGIVVGISIGFMMVASVLLMGTRTASQLLVSKQWHRADFYDYPALLDDQPPGTVVLNVGSRVRNYGLFGKHLTNTVISTPAARDLLNLPHAPLDPVPEAVLHPATLVRHHIDFVFAEETTTRSTGCPRLKEVWRQERNPANGVALARPRLLYQTVACE